MRVALVHDWLTNLGGAERVVEVLHQMYPEAPIYTSVYDKDRLPLLKDADIRTSFLQRWPKAKKKHQLYPMLRTLAFESFDFSQYDLVISSSSAEAKGIITTIETTHVSYIHTPTRYYWSGYADYVDSPGMGIFNPAAKRALPKVVDKMRYWDYAAAHRPDVLVANSVTVQERIKKYYDLSSTVINPPVEIDRFGRGTTTDGDYYLVVSRLIPYKRVDLAVQACSELGKKLVVVGGGSETKRLKSLAGPNVEFKGALTDKETTKLYQAAKAFIFTAFEDFGITPVEAMAAGKPVIGYGKGGAAETVVHEKTGILFNDQSVASLKRAINKFETMSFSSTRISQHAQQYSITTFKEKLQKVVDEAVAQNPA
jgi:glycosyltransferase involved in cell wall biosynthesis